MGIRIGINKLINLKAEFGEFEIGSMGELKEGRDDYKFATSNLYLRFGYWGHVEIEELQKALGGRHTVTENIIDYCEFGTPLFLYELDK